MLEEFKTIVFYASVAALSVLLVLIATAVGLGLVTFIWNALEEWAWEKDCNRNHRRRGE
ncbi:hypothetical protein [Sinorhizobium sp. GL28]|uniref:hypothetical protein n=1 Tax=Sinorhizobium sp. GL28 TaxID=1358418 RepID=UPI0007240D2A|nr:hypothetical protein [Sinorhizobium sp. GL28]KSV94861.1 hypothetical protein N184_36035 [Sinorhizobium sp. GL28]